MLLLHLPPLRVTQRTPVVRVAFQVLTQPERGKTGSRGTCALPQHTSHGSKDPGHAFPGGQAACRHGMDQPMHPQPSVVTADEPVAVQRRGGVLQRQRVGDGAAELVGQQRRVGAEQVWGDPPQARETRTDIAAEPRLARPSRAARRPAARWCPSSPGRRWLAAGQQLVAAGGEQPQVAGSDILVYSIYDAACSRPAADHPVARPAPQPLLRPRCQCGGSARSGFGTAQHLHRERGLAYPTNPCSARIWTTAAADSPPRASRSRLIS
jgi:hypothetical protein